MTVEYQGKKPGRLWYFRQRTGAFLQTFKDTSSRRQARVMRRDALISLGAIGLGVALLNVSYAALVPFLVSWGAPISGGIGLLAGYKSWRNAKALGQHRVARAYIRDAEQRWLDKKARPSLRTRIKAGISAGIAACIRVARAPFSARHRDTSQTVTHDGAGNEGAGMITRDTAPSALGDATVADTFDSARTRPVDPQQAEAARKRAEARLQRRKNGRG